MGSRSCIELPHPHISDFSETDMTISRRQFHKNALAAGAFVALPGGSFAAAEEPVSGGTLKIV